MKTIMSSIAVAVLIAARRIVGAGGASYEWLVLALVGAGLANVVLATRLRRQRRA